MISYEPFWETLKEKNMSTYILINQFGISSSTINRLRHNQPISTTTLDDLCRFMHCRVEDILQYIPEDAETSAPETDLSESVCTHRKI